MSRTRIQPNSLSLLTMYRLIRVRLSKLARKKAIDLSVYCTVIFKEINLSYFRHLGSVYL